VERPSHSLGFFEGRFNALLQEHDVAFEAKAERTIPDDGETERILSKIVDELNRLIRRAARTKPTSNRDVALLLHMAIINLGIDLEGDLPGHDALRTALRSLEGNKRPNAEFQKMKLSP
jgi:hypothetical protein